MFSVGKLGVVLAAALLAAPLAARAQTFDMSYTGTDSGFGYTQGTTTGTGSFTLTDGTLSAFTLTVTESAGPGETDVFTWGLNDIENFQDTLANGQITYLSLLTDVQGGYYTPNQQFADNDPVFSPVGAATFDLDTGPITVGTLTITPDDLPEPGSLAILGVGLVALSTAPGRKFLRPLARKRAA